MAMYDKVFATNCFFCNNIVCAVPNKTRFSRFSGECARKPIYNASCYCHTKRIAIVERRARGIPEALAFVCIDRDFSKWFWQKIVLPALARIFPFFGIAKMKKSFQNIENNFLFERVFFAVSEISSDMIRNRASSTVVHYHDSVFQKPKLSRCFYVNHFLHILNFQKMVALEAVSEIVSPGTPRNSRKYRVKI